MPLASDQAVCLRVSPFSETSQIVTLFTREHGRLRLIAKGARRHTKSGKSKFDGGLDLLDGGDAVFSFAPERELAILIEWRLRDRHQPLREALRPLYLGLFAAELVERLLEEQDPNPKLFDQLQRLLVRLSEPKAREAVSLAFCLNLLRQVGVLPDFSRCEGAPSPQQSRHLGFSPGLSRLVCDDRLVETPDAVPLPHAALGAMTSLLRLARAGGPLPTLEQSQVDPAYRVLVAHIQEQTGTRLKSARYVQAYTK